MKIEYVSADKLIPYKKNAKLHPKSQIEQIKKSITKFGMNDPIAVWGQNNIVVEGHGRLIACKELKMDKVPVIRLDDLTDEQRRAYTLIHNKLTMNTGFDMAKLDEELAKISIPMVDYGFLGDVEVTEGSTQSINPGGELDVSDFAAEKYNCKCPMCGFLFTAKGRKGNYSGDADV